jgi:hypothetical protein
MELAGNRINIAKRIQHEFNGQVVSRELLSAWSGTEERGRHHGVMRAVQFLTAG